MDAWRDNQTDFGDVFADTTAFSMDDDDFGTAGSGDDAFADAAPVVVTVAKEKKEKKAMEETKKTVEPANADKGAKKARQTLVKWGFEGADVDLALGATEAATVDALVEGQTEFNKKRQVAALDWLLLNAPEDSIPVEYRNDAIRARS